MTLERTRFGGLFRKFKEIHILQALKGKGISFPKHIPLKSLKVFRIFSSVYLSVFPATSLPPTHSILPLK